MAGNFQDGIDRREDAVRRGWWFLDQKEGMEWQINALSNNGLLSRFVGMLTDSRSFLSYTRHEYFRRVLCDLLGSKSSGATSRRTGNWSGAWSAGSALPTPGIISGSNSTRTSGAERQGAAFLKGIPVRSVLYPVLPWIPPRRRQIP